MGELTAFNEQQMEIIQSMRRTIDAQRAELAAVKAENAKLREALGELIDSLEIAFTGIELRERVPEIKNARAVLGGK